MTEQRERRKVQLESLLGTALGQERLIEAYCTKCPATGTNGVISATKPATAARLQEMIAAILNVEFPNAM